MSLDEILDQIETQYYGELEEDREAVIPVLTEVHNEIASQGEEATIQFEKEVATRLGGIYIPYLFWKALSRFMDDNESRVRLFGLIEAFTQSSFDEEEQKKMKPLLITYFAVEKEFETDKVQNLIVAKAHPQVQEYFKKLIEFTKNNKNSVSLYEEKFQILKHSEPDFDLLKMPVNRLKEKMETA